LLIAIGLTPGGRSTLHT